jgi:hypothetical protein
MTRMIILVEQEPEREHDSMKSSGTAWNLPAREFFHPVQNVTTPRDQSQALLE